MLGPCTQVQGRQPLAIRAGSHPQLMHASSCPERRLSGPDTCAPSSSTLKITGGCRCTVPGIQFLTWTSRKLAHMSDSPQEHTTPVQTANTPTPVRPDTQPEHPKRPHNPTSNHKKDRPTPHTEKEGPTPLQTTRPTPKPTPTTQHPTQPPNTGDRTNSTT